MMTYMHFGIKEREVMGVEELGGKVFQRQSSGVHLLSTCFVERSFLGTIKEWKSDTDLTGKEGE